MIKLLILSDFTREPERILLKGLMEYANGHGGCKLFPVTNLINEDPSKAQMIIDRAKSLGVDAIFGKWPGIDVQKARDLGIPVVLRTIDKDYPEFPMLSGNYMEIGRVAAEFLIRNHYESFAFFGAENLLWSRERNRGFRNALGPKAVFSQYQFRHVDKEWDLIGHWLRQLPKGTAVYACSDVYARIITEIAQDYGVDIPKDVALLGTDDDEFLCNISSPAISSIRLDFHTQGRELGKAIFSMVEKGGMWPERILIRPMGITERDSTKRHNISDPIIEKIVARIENDYASIAGVGDIIQDIPLTRRSIEQRFKKQMSPDTMSTFLGRVRIARMCHLLEHTDLTIAEAGEKVGIMDPFYIGKIFKRFIGTPPSVYRKRFTKD